MRTSLKRAGSNCLTSLYTRPPLQEVSRRTNVATAGAFILAAFGLIFSLLRQPGSALDSPWAEDGTVYLDAAYRLPWWHAIFLSYNGYVSIYPSGVALVAAAGPARFAATVMALGGALATACAVLITVVASAGYLESVVLRLLLGLGVGAFPLAGAEIAANSCNAQWYLLLATFWCLLWRPRNRIAIAAATVVPFLSAGTDPLTGLLLPLAVLRYLAGPRRGRQAVLANLPTAGLIIGLLLQTGSLVHPSLQPVSAHPTGPVLLETWVYKVPELALLGPGLARRSGWWGLGVAVAALVVALVLAFVIGRGPLTVVSLSMSALLFMVPSYLRWRSSGGVFTTFGIQTRYVFSAWAIALLVFFLGVDGYLRSSRSRFRKAAILVLVAAVVCVPVIRDARGGRDRSPSWSDQIRAQSRFCAAALNHGEDTDVAARVVVAPRSSYVVHVPCRRLTGR